MSCMSCKERGRRAWINGDSDLEKEEYAVGMGLGDPAASALGGGRLTCRLYAPKGVVFESRSWAKL